MDLDALISSQAISPLVSIKGGACDLTSGTDV